MPDNFQGLCMVKTIFNPGWWVTPREVEIRRIKV
jgi:hypothetical protein